MQDHIKKIIESGGDFSLLGKPIESLSLIRIEVILFQDVGVNLVNLLHQVIGVFFISFYLRFQILILCVQIFGLFIQPIKLTLGLQNLPDY